MSPSQDVAPLRLPTESFYGLLTNPPGYYGIVPYGGTTAVTLRGCPAFLTAAQNMFSSFGGESQHPDGRGGFRRESREPVFYKGDEPGTVYFCMPSARVKTAVRLYLYGQLWEAKGIRQDVLDADGDYADTVCSNEEALMEEAAQLAESFCAHEMPSDYAALPERGRAAVQDTEYQVVWPQHESDDGEA